MQYDYVDDDKESLLDKYLKLHESHKLLSEGIQNLIEDGHLYILDKHYEPEMPDDEEDFFIWHNTSHKKMVGYLEIGFYTIVTKFTGICLSRRETDQLFESTINTGYVKRYKTYGEAKKGHLELVKEYIEIAEAEAKRNEEARKNSKRIDWNKEVEKAQENTEVQE